MKRTASIWIVVIAAYAAFLAWHQPLRGPLTELEVRAAFGDRYSPMREAKDGRAATLIDFFLSDDGRPFLIRQRAKWISTEPQILKWEVLLGHQ